MATVVDRPIATSADEDAAREQQPSRPSKRPRRRTRGAGASRWLAVLVLGFVVGAALVLLTDSNSGTPQISSTPSGGGASSAGSSTAASSGVSDLNGHHVHGVKAQDIAAETQPDVPLDAPTRELLAQQLTEARAHALQYPTVADAEAAGYRLAGGFAAGSGAHYIGIQMTGAGTFDPNAAQSLIYDGTSPTSHIVGLMYYSMGATAPEGFAGPNDHWHRHSNVCIKYVNGQVNVPFPADADISQAQCSAAGGMFISVTGWMVHAWVVPGWESPEGVFSHENGNLRCADGTFNTDKNGMCQGT